MFSCELELHMTLFAIQIVFNIGLRGVFWCHAVSSLLQGSYLFLRVATLGTIPGFCVGSMSERAQCIETSLLSSCNANINHNLYINVDDTCISMFSYAHRIKVRTSCTIVTRLFPSPKRHLLGGATEKRTESEECWDTVWLEWNALSEFREFNVKRIFGVRTSFFLRGTVQFSNCAPLKEEDRAIKCGFTLNSLKR